MSRNAKPVSYASAPGKVILFGEHAVVYGHPSLGFPLSKVAMVTMRSSPGKGCVSIETKKGIFVGDTSQAAPPAALARRVFGDAVDDLDLRIRLDFPPMSGFGSSAAIALALLELKLTAEGKTRSPRPMWRAAVDAETVAHAKPSGVDPAICLYGTKYRAPIRYVRPMDNPDHPKITRVKLKQPTPIVVSTAGAHGGTAKTVSRLAQMKANPASERLISQAMAALGEATDTGTRALQTGDLVLAGHAMDLAHGVLSGLGLVSDKVDEMVRLSKASGALGAKMSGAGGAGGAFIALAGTPKAAGRIKRALSKAGLFAWVETLEPGF